jgi:uncharacterized tellurite resistance protein B-like protein
MNLASALSALDQKEIEEIESELLNSPAFKETSKVITDDKSSLLISSVCSGLLYMAWLDRDLTKLEVKYLIRELKEFGEIDKEKRKELIILHSHLIKNETSFKEYIPLHFAYLKSILTSEQRLQLYQDFIIISRSDLDISRKETDLIKSLGTYLKISKATQDDLLVNAKFVVIQRLSEAAEDEPMVVLETPYSIPTIKLDL